MDLCAHAIAESCVNNSVTRERQLAAKCFADNLGLKMHAILATHRDACAGKPGFDQLAYAVCIHGLCFQALSDDENLQSRSAAGVRYNIGLA